MEIKFPQGMTIQKMLEELVIMSDYGQSIGHNAPTDENGFKDWFKIEASVYNITNKAQEKKFTHGFHRLIILITHFPNLKTNIGISVFISNYINTCSSNKFRFF